MVELVLPLAGCNTWESCPGAPCLGSTEELTPWESLPEVRSEEELAPPLLAFGGTDTGEMALPLAACGTWLSWLLPLPGSCWRSGIDGVGEGELAPMA